MTAWHSQAADFNLSHDWAFSNLVLWYGRRKTWNRNEEKFVGLHHWSLTFELETMLSWYKVWSVALRQTTLSALLTTSTFSKEMSLHKSITRPLNDPKNDKRSTVSWIIFDFLRHFLLKNFVTCFICLAEFWSINWWINQNLHLNILFMFWVYSFHYWDVLMARSDLWLDDDTQYSQYSQLSLNSFVLLSPQ